jgi:hypothetical protein
MQNTPAREIPDDLLHGVGVKRPEDVQAFIGKDENVNR